MITMRDVILRETRLDPHRLDKDRTLENYNHTIEKYYKDIVLKDMLRNLLIDVLDSGSEYYFNRYNNLESFQFDWKPEKFKFSLCIWNPINIEKNQDLELKFKLIEKRLLK